MDNLREHYIHELKLDGVRASTSYWSLVHPTAFYTLHNVPDGEKLKAADINTKSATTTTATAKVTEKKAPQVGPAYTEVAKRKYSNEKIVDLIYNPQPQNWPDYATPMAPMPQVPRADALKIAAWINSLARKAAPKP